MRIVRPNRGKAVLLFVTLPAVLILLPLLAPPEVASLTAPAVEVLVTEAEQGSEIELHPGQLLTLRLAANPSTGYNWEVESIDPAALREVGEPEFESEPGRLGAPGTVTLRFQPLVAGSSPLVLAYRRSWEQGPALKTFGLELKAVGDFSGDEVSLPPSAAELEPRQAPANMGEPQVTASAAIPSAFNWCDLGGCTPVKNQGSCGSCWAFGTVGALENNIQIVDGVTRDLSEQYLVSCNREGHDCDGGWWVHQYHQDYAPPGEPAAGAVYEASFPYVAYDANCQSPYTHHETINSWAYVGDSDGVPSVAAMKQAIYDHGPIAVAVCVGDSFGDYDSGVYTTNEWCSGAVNHGVVLVGWDDNQGPAGVWYLRNSWGPFWGESGYMRIAYGTSNVGFGASYVVYKLGTLPHAPLAPGNLNAVGLPGRQVLVTWADTSSNESGFYVERSPDGTSGWSQIATVGAGVTSHVDSGLPLAEDFFYRVRAYNSQGTSDYSNVARAFTFNDYDEMFFIPLVFRALQASSAGLPIDEGFESGSIPPTGWVRLQTNPRQTWTRTTDSFGGSYAALCLYDDWVEYQNEVLISPQFQASSAQLRFHSFGSAHWCRDTYDNCDLNVWLVVGDWGGGNDILVGRAEDDWLGTWVWSLTDIDLTPFLPAGVPVRLAFQYVGQDGAEARLDDVYVGP